MSRYKVIAIVGEAGSGKDSLLQRLCKKIDGNEIISYTTRPKRDYEKDGVNYYFVTVDEFAELINKDKMLEATVFNGWAYGTAIDSLKPNKINIGVFNPEGVEYLCENSNVDVLIIHCMCSPKTRLLRQLNREINPDINEIIRRFAADAKDFKAFKDFIVHDRPDVLIIDTEGNTVEQEADVAIRGLINWLVIDNKEDIIKHACTKT